MKPKPYRFKLPVVGIAVTALLLFLQNSFHTSFFAILLVICDLINWPAMLIYQYLAIFVGIHVWGFHSWYNLRLYLALVGLWWYFVGSELDFDLLRSIGKRVPLFRVCWLLCTAGIQTILVWSLYGTVMEIGRPHVASPRMAISDYFLDGLLLLIFVGCIEVVCLRFWRASRPLPLFTKRHSL